MSKLVWIFILLASIFSNSFAHSPRCSTDEFYELVKKSNPNVENKLQEKETPFQEKRQNNPFHAIIQVVVHIVYNTASENVSDDAVFSQIDVLNEDYRRLNTDANQTSSIFSSIARDLGINFVLARTDPFGNSTTGITRTFTSSPVFTIDDLVKNSSTNGVDSWDTNRYLNIWVCDLDRYGYATFPGTVDPRLDGVVIDFSVFGKPGTVARYDLGRTTTHEVGHFFNLNHPWGDFLGDCNEDDLVADTPLEDSPTFGCPAQRISCNNNVMVENFMDYTDDGCMNAFTEGQMNRVHAVLVAGGYRYNLTQQIIPRCGDGFIGGLELCDDFNSLPFDGCSTSCNIEYGWNCINRKTSNCSTTCPFVLAEDFDTLLSWNTSMGASILSDTESIQRNYLKLVSNTSGEYAITPIVSLSSGRNFLYFYAKFESNDDCNNWFSTWVENGTTRQYLQVNCNITWNLYSLNISDFANQNVSFGFQIIPGNETNVFSLDYLRILPDCLIQNTLISTTSVATSGSQTSGLITTQFLTSNVVTSSIVTSSEITSGILSTGRNSVTTASQPLTTSRVTTAAPFTTGLRRFTTGQLTTNAISTDAVTTNVVTSSVVTTSHIGENATTGEDNVSQESLSTPVTFNASRYLIIAFAAAAGCCVLTIAIALIIQKTKKLRKGKGTTGEWVELPHLFSERV